MSSVPSSSSVCSTPSAPFPRMRAVHGKSKSISRSTASEFYVSLSSDLRLLAVKPGGTAPSSLLSFRDGEAAFCLKLKRMEDFSQDSPIERVVADRVKPYGGPVDHAVIITEGKKSVVLFTKNDKERNKWLKDLHMRVAPLSVLHNHIMTEIRSKELIPGFNLSVPDLARGIIDFDNPENKQAESTARWAKRLWSLFDTGKKPIDCTSGLMRALAGASKNLKDLAQPFSALGVVGSVFAFISLTASTVYLITTEREGKVKLEKAHTELHMASLFLLKCFVEILRSGFENEKLVDYVFNAIGKSWDAAADVEQYLLQRWFKRVWNAEDIKELNTKVDSVTERLLVVGTLKEVAEAKKDIGDLKEDVDEMKKNVDEVKKDVGELKEDATEMKDAIVALKDDAKETNAKVDGIAGIIDEFKPCIPDSAELKKGLLCGVVEQTLAQLKGHVLPRSNADTVVRRVAVASVSGEGGVGKTSACRLLCADPEVLNHFDDGAILWLELGPGVSDAKVKNRIASIVADCGGRLTAERIRAAVDVEDAVNLARGFFSSQRILLVIDNVWKPTADSKVKDWMTELFKIACCDGSVVVMSTRFNDLSKAPGLEHVRLGRLNLEEGNSPDWKIAEALYDYHRNYRIEENCSNSYARPQKQARRECPRKRALKLSCGIPLAIGMIGSLIRELGRGCGGAEAVLSSIESKDGGLASKSSGEDAFSFVGHEGICAVMSECLNFLDECKRGHDIFRTRRGERQTDCDSQFSASYKSFSDRPMSSRYTALEAMDKSATHLTFEVLRHLWHLRSAFEAREVAQMFENVGLGRIVRHGESDDEAIFSVHDLQYAYCTDVSSSFYVNGDDARASINGHLLLLSGCKSTFGRKRTEVHWASVCFFSERFCDEDELPSVPAKSVSQHLGQNLFSHLCETYRDCSKESEKEMVRVLTDYRWVRGRGAAHGRVGVISDFMMAESVLGCGGEQQQSYVRPIHLLRRVVQLAPENAYTSIPGEMDSALAWHIAGRIHEEKVTGRYSEFEVEVFEKLIWSTEKNVRGAWLRPRNGCFSRMSVDPRMASDILVNRKPGMGHNVPVADLGDGEHIVCGGEDGVQIRKVISTDLALHVGSGKVFDDAVANCERERSYFVFVLELPALRVMIVAKDNAGGLSQDGEYKFFSGTKGGGPMGFAVSKNGLRVVGCFTRHVIYWKRKDGDEPLSYEEVWRFSLPTGDIYFNTIPASIAISQSGDFVVAVLQESLLFWKKADSVEGDTSERKPTEHVRGEGEGIWSIALSPTGSSLFMALETGVVEVWDVASENRRDWIKVHEVSGVVYGDSMCLSLLEEPLGATGVVAGGRLFVGVNASVMEYSAKDLRLITNYDVSSGFMRICALVSRKCERMIAVGCTDGTIRVLRSTGAAGGRPTVSSGKNIIDPVSRVTIAPKRDIVLAGHRSGMLSMWSSSTGVDCGSFETAHSGVVTCIDVSDDEEFAVSGSADKSIRVLNLKSKKLHVVLNGHTRSVFDVRWSDNRRIVSSDKSGEIRIWDGKEDVTTLTVIPADKHVRNPCNPWLFVSQDGEHCLSVSASTYDGFFGHLFALKDGHTITSCLGDRGSISPVEFLDELRDLCVDITNGFRTLSCVARGESNVKLFLGTGTSSHLDVRTVGTSYGKARISCCESAADLKKCPSVDAQLNNDVSCIAVAPAPTRAGSPRRVTIACSVNESGTPAIMHYMFST